MLFTDWLSLLTICILGATFPGASLAVVLRQTRDHSRLHGVVTGIAHGGGVGLYAVCSVLGLVTVLQQSPLAFQLISYAGAAYLAWLGYRGISATAAGVENLPKQGSSASLWGAAREGLTIALLNPKIGLFFLALFSQFVHEEMNPSAKMIFVATIMLVDGGWYVLVATLLAHGPVLNWLRRHQLWSERVFGLVLILLALRILLFGGQSSQ